MGVVERLECDGVEALRVGRFGTKVNTACVLYRVGSTVIDTGPANQWPAVRRFLREKPLAQALVTHYHEDHAGNLARIAREFGPGVRTLAPAATVPFLAEGFPIERYRRVIWGSPRGRVRPEPVPQEIPLGTGSWLVPVATPGHSPDMTCYLEPNRGWLFCGDLFIATRLHYLRRGEDLAGILASLRLIQRYEFDTVFCGHRGPVRGGKEALRKKLDNVEALCRQVASLHRAGNGVREITRRLLGREGFVALFSGGRFSKRSLIEECLRLGQPSPAGM